MYFCHSIFRIYRIMKKISIFSLLTVMCLCAVAQSVSFTGRDADSRYAQLNRVVITNHTQGWQETLYWPDTTLILKNGTGIDDFSENNGFVLSQNIPNPFKATTNVRLTVAEAGEVSLEIIDMNGRKIVEKSFSDVSAGIHNYRVNLSKTGMYVMTARQNGKQTSIKMVCGEGGGANQLEYAGAAEMSLETFLQTNDRMEYVGYIIVDGEERETKHVMQTLDNSKTVVLPLAKIYDGNNMVQLTNKHKGGEKASPAEDAEGFRVALSLSPFSLNQFEQGYTFVIGDSIATTPEELQSIYRSLGSTEMYVRIATKRHKTAENTTDGEPDENANVHTFDQGIQLCQIAAALNIPINPEIMCAYTYMDMDRVQKPRFEEYPEIYALQNGKEWSELSLDEICVVLEAYGEFVADAILATGCTVNNWNLGNEANFGFAGVGMGTETAVDAKLGKASAMKRYMASVFSTWWLKKHVWAYNVKEFAAIKSGILKAYEKRNLDASHVKFSTHIATVVFTVRCSASYFQYMAKHGYAVETAGISYYPSAPAMSFNKKKLLTKTITRINKKCHVPVFIGEFSYPSGKMDGPFASWNKKLKGYEKDQQGQANIYRDVIAWGKTHGMAGIRYWAPDYEGWYSMSMYEFSNKKGTAKTILKNHKEIVGN